MKSIFITVRTGSSRLPNKSTLDLCGKSSIEWLIETMKTSKSADQIILCTTCRVEDDVLCNLAVKHGIQYFRGSSEDKLSRWLGACEKFNVDFFVNVDGDDLFFDVDLADHVIDQWTPRGAYVDFIDGHGLYNDVYGITKRALEEVCRIKGTDDTEYIRPYFTETDRFEVEPPKRLPEKYLKTDARMTLDYPDDLTFFEAVIHGLGSLPLTFDNILHLLEIRPEVKKINNHLENEWKENQEKIKRLILKDEE